MGIVNLILLHGLAGLADDLTILFVRFCWLTVVLIAILFIKRIITSNLKAIEKGAMIFVALLLFALTSMICSLLLPSTRYPNITLFDIRPLLGISSFLVWLAVALDAVAITQLRKRPSAGKIFIVLILPVIGAGFVLIVDRINRRQGLCSLAAPDKRFNRTDS